eukprot:25313_1
MTCLVLLTLRLVLTVFLTVTAGKRQNILLILVDDLGNSDASFNFNITHPYANIGDAPIATPHLDYLAHSGIIFSNHYTHYICGPSRSALLTSRYSVHLGNPFDILHKGGGLDPFIPTFAHQLKERNYRNSFIGKWGIDSDGRYYNHLSRQWSPSLTTLYPNNKYNNHGEGPFARGFDNFYGLYNSEHDHFRKTFMMMPDWHIFNETHMLEAPSIDTETHVSSTHVFVRETIHKMNDYINKQSPYYQQPFFIHLSFTMPHDPLQVDERYIAHSTACANITNYRRKMYCGMVQCVDEGIKNITQFMKRHHLLDKTIILFTSDNGGTPNFGGFNYPYRGGKASSFNGGVKTPAFIYAPNVFKRTSGLVYDGYIHVVDYGPTLLSIVDETDTSEHGMESDINGIDLSGILQHFDEENAGKYKVRNDMIVEHNGWANMSAFIDGNYKLLLGHTGISKVYAEPNGFWDVNEKDAAWINTMHQIFNYGIEFIVPPDVYSGLEWCFNFNTQWYRVPILDGVLWNAFKHEQIISVHPMAKQHKSQPLYVPYFDWNDRESVKNIRLYNIKQDPFELNNIAMDNKAKVEALYQKLVEQLTKGAKSKWAKDKSYVFHYGNYILFRIIISIFAILLLMICFVIRCMYRIFCYKVITKAKID